MFTFLSLVTSMKDYVEVVHKLIETDANFSLNSYYDFGSIFTFLLLTGKEVAKNFFSFQWFQNFWAIPTIVPNIASSLISEISVFDGSLKNSQTFFESPFSYGNQNFFLYCIEKFMIGFLNSLFLCFPTSLSHIITLRRFVMQGLEAGFISGLGTIVGNIVWIASIIFGLRFVVIPWVSLDLFRYFLGFLLIVKYMWDSTHERRMVLEDFSKYKIFFLTFLLSFTEQTTIYPFLSNLSFGSDTTFFESFPTENFSGFAFLHCCYLLGLLVGSLSLLQFTCWFWENPAFQIYMWFLSSFQITKNISSKLVNFLFLYLTMICTISNFSYFGLDYTLTNPLGFVHEDRLFESKAFLETAFLNTKASDRNTRKNRGRHGRRERWKRRVRKYRTFDVSVYDQGIYDLFTIEDLNYGFDRFWLRRKIRNHRVRFRFFPGPWMRSFKKQLSRPRLESFLGPRVEFFRILFEQAYHPEFHEFSSHHTKNEQYDWLRHKNLLKEQNQSQIFSNRNSNFFGLSKTNENIQIDKNEQTGYFQNFGNQNFISWNLPKNKKQRILKEQSTVRKFLRKVQNRVKQAKIDYEIKNPQTFGLSVENSKNMMKPISSKTWRIFTGNEKRNFPLFSSQNLKTKEKQKPFFQSSISPKSEENFFFERFYKKLFSREAGDSQNSNIEKNRKKDLKKHFSKKDLFLQRYKMFLYSKTENSTSFVSKNQKEKNSNPSQPINLSGPEAPHLNSSNIEHVALPQRGIGLQNLKQKNSLVFSSSSEQNLQKNSGLFSALAPQSEQAEQKNASRYRAMTLLHPLQFYFQKEQALKRKFQFYGVQLFRNFHVENNAPYFRVFMKRFFYHYKPTLRWERTLRVATNRRARRKSSRIPRKFNVSKNTQMLSQIENSNFSENSNVLTTPNNFQRSEIRDPTHFYSLVDKRASRYRFQIYKDVLQHWYYSPLNRLLLKIDVDSFIRRQPNSYFLTKNDEKLLHLKRQLLSEYYDTLRWYTSMEHYETMKNQIGGTKSLSNRAYNQQFAGTFKKIRHFFNITPSFRETSVLKFDQPLYNEYTKSGNGSVFKDSVLHEELFSDNFFFFSETSNANIVPLAKQTGRTEHEPKKSNDSPDLVVSKTPENLINQSLTILREYLSTAAPIRQQYIETLLKEKNYWELTKFLFKGQKICGTGPITNETDFLNQEKDALFLEKPFSNSFNIEANTSAFKDEIWISLLKKCQKKLYDQEALKNYVTLKKEKYEIQKQRHEKYLKNRFQRIKESVLQNPEILNLAENQRNFEQTLSNIEKKKIENFKNFSGYPSSLNKAIQESILWENNSFANSSFQTLDKFFQSNQADRFARFAYRGKKLFQEKTNIRKNQFPMYSALEKQNRLLAPFFAKQKKQVVQQEGVENNESTKINTQKMRSIVFSKNLRFSVKKQALQILETEQKIQEKFTNSSKKSHFLGFPKIVQYFFTNTRNIFWDILRFKNIFDSKESSNQNFLQNFNILHSTSNFQKSSDTYQKKKKSLGLSGIKDIEFWKKRENILAKRKKLRKTFKRLRNQKTPTEKIVFENNDFFSPLSEHRNFSTENRQKIEKNEQEFLKKQKNTRSLSWKKYFDFQSQNSENTKFFDFLLDPQRGRGDKKFQRKRSRLRRYSSFKGRGPIKKRTLREKLKRQFKSLKKYGRNQDTFASEQIAKEREKKKVELIQLITQRKYEADGKFQKRDEKQRRTRQTKHRVWKKKKQNFAQKRRKLRKRRRSTISKLRVFNKKISRILSRKEIQVWWWKTFFPHFQRKTEKTWQLQKNMQIRKQLVELYDEHEKEIFERDKKNEILSSLQIGDKDYKPFAIPEALRIREKLVEQNVLNFGNSESSSFKNFSNENFKENVLQTQKNSSQMQLSTNETQQKNQVPQLMATPFESTQIFDEVNNLIFKEKRQTENSHLLKSQTFDQMNNQSTKSPFFVATNPLPFYAGWDDSLRKFVLTNRFLSRKECFSCSLKGQETFFGTFPESKEKNQKSTKEYQKSPLQGMNAATTLYWQIPFTTYDPDQFFALGMDGFSPIGWRNFSLKHSKQTTKPLLVQNFLSFEPNSESFAKNLQFQIFHQSFQKKNIFSTDPTKRTNQQNQKTEIDKNFEYRRILKKQKRLKKHPRPPVWFPSGSLSQQVLPVHYIYVFYKRSRLPRDRYIRRRLRSSFLNNQNSRENSVFADRTKMIDFTLRKRTKPRRKYHRKRFGDVSPKGEGEQNAFFARRQMFRGFQNEIETTRPSSKLFQTSAFPGTKQEKRILLGKQGDRPKQRRKIQDSKQQTENMRVRQLRRRVQRQVYRPIWRSRPRAGGFVWPGDYLRLEFVKASPLKSTIGSFENETSPQETVQISRSSREASGATRKIRKKARRTLQEWQIQPKKYLFEKHNLKVLKTRIEKSMNINDF